MANTLHTKQNTLNTLNSISAGSWTTGSVSTSSMKWQAPPSNFVSNNGQPIMTIPKDGQTVVLEETATLEVKGTVKINGVDLEERLKTIEKVLMIPERDVTMETKYPSLKKKYDEYINALSKYRTWEAIKGEDDGTT